MISGKMVSFPMFGCIPENALEIFWSFYWFRVILVILEVSMGILVI
jgi:hypothetical protein